MVVDSSTNVPESHRTCERAGEGAEVIRLTLHAGLPSDHTQSAELASSGPKPPGRAGKVTSPSLLHRSIHPAGRRP